MVFSSFIFIFGFLPIVLSLYLISPAKLKNLILVLSSFLFYSWGAPTTSGILLISCIVDYFLVKISITRNESIKKLITFFTVGSNLATLFYFKYTNFFIHQFQSFSGHEFSTWKDIILPIGISFITFHKISYLVDVYRKTTRPAASFADYFLYIIFFPQLIAGPILRYKDIGGQIIQRKLTKNLFIYGIVRFFIGLGKKIVLADQMGLVANNVFSLDPDALTMQYAWIGAIAYSFQIYFDFSGYSGMAIGLCALFGFNIAENFNMPYKSASVTEFWKRWHISLSTWMREYLYIPLGGNRQSNLKTARNLWIVFLLSGLWHGANWTFVLWGALHGLMMSIERLFLSKLKIPRMIGIFYTLSFILLSWIIFRAENISSALQFVGVLFNDPENLHPPALGFIIHNRAKFIFAVCTIIIALSWNKSVATYTNAHLKYPLSYPGMLFVFSFVLFLLSVLSLSTNVFSPFIYYQF